MRSRLTEDGKIEITEISHQEFIILREAVKHSFLEMEGCREVLKKCVENYDQVKTTADGIIAQLYKIL